jgi:hypothetical protein
LKAGLDYEELAKNAAKIGKEESAVDQTEATADEACLFSSPDVSIAATGQLANETISANMVVISNSVATADSIRSTEISPVNDAAPSHGMVFKGTLSYM